MKTPALHPLAKVANDALAKDCPVVLELPLRARQALLLPGEGDPGAGRRGEAEGEDRQRHRRHRDRERRADAPRLHRPLLPGAHAGRDLRLRAVVREAGPPRRLGEEAARGDAGPARPARSRTRSSRTPSPTASGWWATSSSIRATRSSAPTSCGRTTTSAGRRGSRREFNSFPFFDAALSGFNLTGFTAALAKHRGQEAGRLPQLPEQPLRLHPHRGARPTPSRPRSPPRRRRGRSWWWCVDDAYYGMFFDEACRDRVASSAGSPAHPPTCSQSRSTARPRRSSSGGSASGSSPSV